MALLFPHNQPATALRFILYMKGTGRIVAAKHNVARAIVALRDSAPDNFNPVALSPCARTTDSTGCRIIRLRETTGGESKIYEPRIVRE